MTIADESIVFVFGGEYAEAKLAGRAENIISVVNPYTGQVLTEGLDFVVDNTRLIACSDNVKVMREEWLYGKNLPPEITNLGAQYNITDVLLIEPAALAEFKYVITYSSDVKFPEYVYSSQSLEHEIQRVKRGESIDVLLLGDSISNAANSSWEANIPPYKPAWYFAAVDDAKAKLGGGDITLHNHSRSGYGTEWAVSVADDVFSSAPHDITVIAFGMNDASANLSAEKFEENIRATLSARKYKNGAVIFVASILPNPASSLYNLLLREKHRQVLQKLCVEYDGGIIDMMQISSFLISRKHYCEVSGNNFNHPDDYVYGFYREGLSKLLTNP